MIYTLNGISPSRLLALVKQGKLPHIKINGFDANDRPVYDVDIADVLTRDDLKIRESLAAAFVANGIPACWSDIRSYTMNPGTAHTYLDELTPPNNQTHMIIYEFHYYGVGIIERIISDLIAAGIDVCYEVEPEINERFHAALNANSLPPKLDQWPIKGHTWMCTCRICSEIRVSLLHKEIAVVQEDTGWFAHAIFSHPDSPTGWSAHTHIHQRYNHPDFEIVLPISGELTSLIFNQLVERVKAGERFKAGDVCEALWTSEDHKSYNVTFIDAIESGRKVLRVVIPDLHGNLTLAALQAAEAHVDFLLQYDVITPDVDEACKQIVANAQIHDGVPSVEDLKQFAKEADGIIKAGGITTYDDPEDIKAELQDVRDWCKTATDEQLLQQLNLCPTAAAEAIITSAIASRKVSNSPTERP